MPELSLNPFIVLLGTVAHLSCVGTTCISFSPYLQLPENHLHICVIHQHLDHLLASGISIHAVFAMHRGMTSLIVILLLRIVTINTQIHCHINCSIGDMYIYIFTCICVYMYIYIYICINYIHILMYIYIYICIDYRLLS